MTRNCKLDLQIAPPSETTSSLDFCRHTANWSNGNQITISYADATELQAIAILWVARKESEEKYTRLSARAGAEIVQHQSSGFSLKKSLQMFLQKRKHRIQSSMPY